jgi:hypothetical protein
MIAAGLMVIAMIILSALVICTFSKSNCTCAGQAAKTVAPVTKPAETVQAKEPPIPLILPDDPKIGAVKVDITGKWRSCWLDECKTENSIVHLTINYDGTYLVESWNQPERGKWYEEWVAEWIVDENKWEAMNVIIFQPENNNECPWRVKVKNKELILIMYDRNMDFKNLIDDDDSIKYERYR